MVCGVYSLTRCLFSYLFLFFNEGKDVIGLAETGSGKTGAFALPILQALLEKPQRVFALVLTPTRELAYQISEQFCALGSTIGIKCGKLLDFRFKKKSLNVS